MDKSTAAQEEEGELLLAVPSIDCVFAVLSSKPQGHPQEESLPLRKGTYMYIHACIHTYIHTYTYSSAVACSRSQERTEHFVAVYQTYCGHWVPGSSPNKRGGAI